MGDHSQTTLYRRHRGSLADSMETICAVRGFTHLVEVLREDRNGWPDQDEIVADAVKVEPYGGMDDRTGWEDVRRGVEEEFFKVVPHGDTSGIEDMS